MNWVNYVNWTDETALPTASDPAYIRLGIIEEAHECLAAYCALQAAIYGREKRMLRGDPPEVLEAKAAAIAQLREQVIEELGDLAWSVARSMRPLGYAHWPSGEGYVALWRIESMLKCCEREQEPKPTLYASLLWYVLEFMSANVERLSLEDVLDANVKKLVARKAAGTIKGEGSR